MDRVESQEQRENKGVYTSYLERCFDCVIHLRAVVRRKCECLKFLDKHIKTEKGNFSVSGIHAKTLESCCLEILNYFEL